MVKKRRSRSKKEGKSSRPQTNSSSLNNTELDKFFDYDRDSCMRQVVNLNDEVKRIQHVIDNLRLVVEDIRSDRGREECDKLVLDDYLKNCIRRKESEIEALTKKLQELETWITEQHGEHEDRVARLLLEVEAVIERLGSEKANLAGKIASMEEIRVQRDQLQIKFEEINRALEETMEQNQKAYYAKDLEVTVEQKRSVYSFAVLM
ncbi:unnamed protein product [Echinostoma caproni]|uniref:IF rod domain-containing protein n=1 Tax=Echinostoma caproni TaxID=27848 RepID=A0A183BDQ6_9TREM|nr:unnamed protein product [Echinostoma caproni]